MARTARLARMARTARRASARYLMAGTAIILATGGCAWARGATRPETPPAAPTVLRFETTAGTFRIALRAAEAPSFTRNFLHLIAGGGLRQEGFWLTRPDLVQLGSPMTDVDDGGAREIRGSTPWPVAPARDIVGTTFLGTEGAHGFAFTRFPRLSGSLMVRQRFIASGQMLRREYYIALAPGVNRGEVFGQVISGLDVVRRLTRRDAILDVRLE